MGIFYVEETYEHEDINEIFLISVALWLVV